MKTSATAIAAIDAARNEAMVLAEGSLVGERRAAWTRLVMTLSFAILANLTRQISLAGTISGVLYLSFTIGALIVMRYAKPDPDHARLRPVMVAVIDTVFVGSQAVLGQLAGNGFQPGLLALTLAIVMSYSIARMLWQVIFGCVLAVVVFVAVHLIVSTPFVVAQSVFLGGALCVFAVIITSTNASFRGMFRDLRKRDNLTRFLPRQVAERVMNLGPDALAPVQREVTVLFSDIRGFTSMSEGLQPREVLLMLDDYFGRMGLVVKGHDGVLGKFLGDGLLAYWGVPDVLDDHAARAVRAAHDMQRVVVELNAHRATQDLPPIKIGVGIHTGTVAAGMLGGKLQSEYTVIGDAVNVASRVEGLTKEHDAAILISETTWAQLPAVLQAGRKIDGVEIRGRREPLTLYAMQ